MGDFILYMGVGIIVGAISIMVLKEEFDWLTCLLFALVWPIMVLGALGHLFGKTRGK